MADITNRYLFRHLQAGPTAYVRRLKKGRLVATGAGLSFWYRPINAAISELPIEEQERPMLFRARTADHQEVSVQATITYRIADPELTATRVDFSIDTDSGSWRTNPLEHLGGILTELGQQHAITVLAAMTLAEVVASALPELRGAMAAGLRADAWLADAGIIVVGVRVIAVRPEADLEKAMQNPVREELRQEADRATYERRAQAVEQERAISENELHNRIALARREAELVDQQGANDRARATEESAAEEIRVRGRADAIEVTAYARAEDMRVTGLAGAEVQVATLEAYANASQTTLIALAVKELAGSLPNVGTIVISPEMLTPLLARFAGSDHVGNAAVVEAATEIAGELS